ncbi:toprim domain-containing protein [Marivita sp.]|uniref:toprim domain-containing protein n=1 Tax=Marivita sp. TaxID=2003365 RepID=UPI00261DEA65|nr:toprim domain-containing protein [Marivita sp.]
MNNHSNIARDYFGRDADDARNLTQLLDGTWYGHYGTAPCPICQPQKKIHQNALTLRLGLNGKLLLHCKKRDCAFADILAAAGMFCRTYQARDATMLAQRETARQAIERKKAAQAERIWNESLPIAGSIAEKYLWGRGITCDLGASLRYHPKCWHGPTAQRYPALVALVAGASRFSIHRTYLRPDGSGKADILPAKMMLGAVAGGAVRLMDEPGPLVVAEGIETALSLASGLLRTTATIWAALSTSGVRVLQLPEEAGRLTIAPDGDRAGIEAAKTLATRARAFGWKVSLLPAPNGRDWNDILKMKGEVA